MGALDSIRNKRDFERVYADGRRARRGTITVIAVPGAARRSRLGLAVGGRVGGAVTRNRVKRRLRAAVALCPEGAPVDAVVRGATEVTTIEFEELVDDVCGALSEVRSALGRPA